MHMRQYWNIRVYKPQIMTISVQHHVTYHIMKDFKASPSVTNGDGFSRTKESWYSGQHLWMLSHWQVLHSD